jgi:Ohr subfamily peroxiredoxin
VLGANQTFEHKDEHEHDLVAAVNFVIFCAYCFISRKQPHQTMTEKVLFTGKTHTTGGPDGAARSSDGSLDIRLPEPHPAAERLFAAAWSACFIGAIELAASRRKIKLPSAPAIDAEIDLNLGNDGFFLRARLNATIPGVDPEVGRELLAAAHGICPYSKATHGNIEVSTNLL